MISLNIFDNIKKKKQNAENEAVINETKEKIRKHSRGAEQIRTRLENIDIDRYIKLNENNEYTISTEKLEYYKKTINGIIRILFDDAISDADTEEIDQCILELVEYFKNALENGNENTANQVLKAIGESVKCTRVPFDGANEDDKNEKAKRRLVEIRAITTIASLQNYTDKTRITIDKLDKKIEQIEQKKNEASQTFKKLESEDRRLQTQLIQAVNNEIEMTPEIMEYAIASDKANHYTNSLVKHRMLREKKASYVEKVEYCIEQINMMKFGTQEMFGSMTMESFENLYEDFKNDLNRAEEEVRTIGKISTGIDAALTTWFNNSITDDSIYNMVKIHEEIEEEERAEEEKRKAKEAYEKARAEKESIIQKEKIAEKIENNAIVEE